MPDKLTHSELRSVVPASLRRAIRQGRYDEQTAGLAAGRLQCNLAILPESSALDFLRFCQRNPKPCPVVAVGETGDPILHTLGEDIDIRSDVPRYRIFRDGVLAGEQTDISDLWRDDFVTVALGCSFTFEQALISSGIPVRHIDEDHTVPMYSSTIPLTAAGPFGGTMVVTMRPIPAADVARACTISARYPLAHGGPVHVGDPTLIGIPDLSAPDWGQAVTINPGEVPVFWACGVTPQNVLTNAALPICITHAPGHMLVSDIDEHAEVPVFRP